MTRRRGSGTTGAFGGWTRATASAASERPRVRATSVTAPFARHGRTRSAGLGCRRSRREDDDLAEPLAERVAALERELSELDATIDAERAALRGLRAQARSLRAYDVRPVCWPSAARPKSQSARRRSTRRSPRAPAWPRSAALTSRRSAGRFAPERPQAHVRRPHEPYLEQQQRRTRFLELWAAVSTPLLLASVIVVLVASPVAWIIDIAVLACAFIGVEAIARRRFLSFLASMIAAGAAYSALVAGFVLLLLEALADSRSRCWSAPPRSCSCSPTCVRSDAAEAARHSGTMRITRAPWPWRARTPHRRSRRGSGDPRAWRCPRLE